MIVRGRWGFAAGGLARVLPCASLLLALAGCGDEPGNFAVSPGLDPRASRILPIHPGGLLAGRMCLVYLPPGYPKPGSRYPVLYVQDGEQAFDRGVGAAETFGFDTTADALLAAGSIEPMIIVAIPGAGERFRDYIPSIDYDEDAWPDGFWVVDSTRGDGYARSIRDDLKPLVDRTFSTDPSPNGTGIAGFSLGGLISVYALYAYPETFGISGGFSGSYRGFCPLFLRWVRSRGRPPPANLFIDTGLIEDNDVDALVLNGIALEQGFRPGVDYDYRVIAEGTHSVSSVRQRVPAFLEFFSRRARVPTPLAAVIPR